MQRQIGLETSSLMALVEVTSKTPLLQEQIQNALNESGGEVELVTDAASVEEARQKVLLSYERALGNIDKARRVADQTNLTDISELVILSIKCLNQNFTDDIPRWSDTLTPYMGRSTPNEFFEGVKTSLEAKKEAYLSLLTAKNEKLKLASDKIQPYTVIEFGPLEFNLEVKVEPNNMAWPDFLNFFEDLQKKSKRWPARKSISKIMDIYHLYSLYEAGINELWVCDSSFAARYLRNLNYIPPFTEILKKFNLVRIRKNL